MQKETLLKIFEEIYDSIYKDIQKTNRLSMKKVCEILEFKIPNAQDHMDNVLNFLDEYLNLYLLRFMVASEYNFWKEKGIELIDKGITYETFFINFEHNGTIYEGFLSDPVWGHNDNQTMAVLAETIVDEYGIAKAKNPDKKVVGVYALGEKRHLGKQKRIIKALTKAIEDHNQKFQTDYKIDDFIATSANEFVEFLGWKDDKEEYHATLSLAIATGYIQDEFSRYISLNVASLGHDIIKATLPIDQAKESTKFVLEELDFNKVYADIQKNGVANIPGRGFAGYASRKDAKNAALSKKNQNLNQKQPKNQLKNLL